MELWFARPVSLLCPFCQKEIVRNFEEIEDVIMEKPVQIEGEFMVIDVSNYDYANQDSCEHVAFTCTRGFSDPEFTSEYEQVIKDAVSFIYENSGGDIEDNDILEDLLGMNDSFGAFTLEDFKEALPNYDVALESVYVEKGAGPRGGGPTYVVLFLRQKDLKTRALG